CEHIHELSSRNGNEDIGHRGDRYRHDGHWLWYDRHFRNNQHFRFVHEHESGTGSLNKLSSIVRNRWAIDPPVSLFNSPASVRGGFIGVESQKIFVGHFAKMQNMPFFETADACNPK